jgi:hypothetical protein
MEEKAIIRGVARSLTRKIVTTLQQKVFVLVAPHGKGRREEGEKANQLGFSQSATITAVSCLLGLELPRYSGFARGFD